MGLPTPDLTTGQAGARSYLLVQRYDRRAAGDRWRRLHQEDFCQALGKPPTAKYEASQTGIPGPTLAEMFETTRRLMAPSCLLQLLDMAIFNVIACNTDAHAKNYSLMITGAGVSLAPLYDVMCAQPWSHVTMKLALSVGGETRGERLTGSHWRRFANACGLNGRQVIARARALAESAAEHADAAAAEVAAMSAGGHAILDETRIAVLDRAHALLARLDEAEDVSCEPVSALADVPLGG
jgi:serine/threonine-protein kinase HipA